jgi:transcriptional regulator with PAS, ATPase and Fis domain
VWRFWERPLVHDLRPYEKLQSILLLKDVIRRWWNVELAFADTRGYVLDHAEGKIIPPNNDFCRLALFAPEGFRRCNESVKIVRDKLKGTTRPRRSVVHRCHLGFDVVGCPIFLDGEFAGFIFVGGAVAERLSRVERDQVLVKIHELTATREPAAELERSLDRVPIMSEGELTQLQDLLELGAQEVENVHAERKRRELERPPAVDAGNDGPRFESIVGRSRPMQSLFRLLEKIIESESTVLIQGESGTGKELVARAIHYNGPRAKKAFIVQNCSAFTDSLLESALFGHSKGSFTGAVRDKKGLFEVADGGTFFLDEIGDMSPALQVKLLRVLQEGTFTPVGSTETRSTDVRVIAATHKDLQKMVERAEFREDLYYRINVIKVQVPALRERVEDLPLLIDHFLHKHFHGTGRPPRLSPGAMTAIQRYAWPGNIRELENEIERLLVLGGDLGEIPLDLLSPRIREAEARKDSNGSAAAHLSHYESLGSLKSAVEALERDMIHQGLIRTHWNKSQLAKELGISRSNLIMKVERYGLDRKE